MNLCETGIQHISIFNPLFFSPTTLDAGRSMLLAACLVAMIACATARPTYNFTIPQAIPPALDQLEEAAKASYIDRAVDAPESGVAEASTRKTVVLVTVSTGYMDFFRNWLYYYRRLVCVKQKKMMLLWLLFLAV